MFGIEWLRQGSLVEKEISVLANEVEVIVSAKRRACDVLMRHPSREPDSFRLTDPTGKIIRAHIPLPFPLPRLSDSA
jgi:hypothetical protein